MMRREIELRLEVIKNLSEDNPAAATQEEVKLYADFVRYVTTLDIDPLAEKAKLVLSTQELRFQRTYNPS